MNKTYLLLFLLLPTLIVFLFLSLSSQKGAKDIKSYKKLISIKSKKNSNYLAPPNLVSDGYNLINLSYLTHHRNNTPYKTTPMSY